MSHDRQKGRDSNSNTSKPAQFNFSRYPLGLWPADTHLPQLILLTWLTSVAPSFEKPGRFATCYKRINQPTNTGWFFFLRGLHRNYSAMMLWSWPRYFWWNSTTYYVDWNINIYIYNTNKYQQIGVYRHLQLISSCFAMKRQWKVNHQSWGASTDFSTCRLWPKILMTFWPKLLPQTLRAPKGSLTQSEISEATNIRRHPLWKVAGRCLSWPRTAMRPEPELPVDALNPGIARPQWESRRRDGRPTPSFHAKQKHRSSHLQSRTGHWPGHLGAVPPQQVPRTRPGWRIESCFSHHQRNRSPPLW